MEFGWSFQGIRCQILYKEDTFMNDNDYVCLFTLCGGFNASDNHICQQKVW